MLMDTVTYKGDYMLLTLLATCLTWQCAANVTADYYNIDRKLVYAIIMVESSGNIHVKPSKTKDYGIMQINRVNVKDHRIYSDYKFQILYGVAILQQLKAKRYRVCRYNLGIGPMTPQRERFCVKYSARLKNFGYIAKN
jgi:soluble lytic murein transglycosylase-like protein